MKQNIKHESFATADELEEFVSKNIVRSQVQDIEFAGGKWFVWFWKV